MFLTTSIATYMDQNSHGLEAEGVEAEQIINSLLKTVVLTIIALFVIPVPYTQVTEVMRPTSGLCQTLSNTPQSSWEKSQPGDKTSGLLHLYTL